MNQLINAMKINAEDKERASSVKYVSIGILQKGFSLDTKIKSIKICDFKYGKTLSGKHCHLITRVKNCLLFSE